MRRLAGVWRPADLRQERLSPGLVRECLRLLAGAREHRLEESVDTLVGTGEQVPVDRQRGRHLGVAELGRDLERIPPASLSHDAVAWRRSWNVAPRCARSRGRGRPRSSTPTTSMSEVVIDATA